jgi:hypothetical protein
VVALPARDSPAKLPQTRFVDWALGCTLITKNREI